jgi:hypothetical protein
MDSRERKVSRTRLGWGFCRASLDATEEPTPVPRAPKPIGCLPFLFSEKRRGPRGRAVPLPPQGRSGSSPREPEPKQSKPERAREHHPKCEVHRSSSGMEFLQVERKHPSPGAPSECKMDMIPIHCSSLLRASVGVVKCKDSVDPCTM